jgi:excisionase family DNA binding protein
MNQPNELLTVAEVARWLRVDRRTVYRWLRGGELPHRRVGQGGLTGGNVRYHLISSIP